MSNTSLSYILFSIVDHRISVISPVFIQYKLCENFLLKSLTYIFYSLKTKENFWTFRTVVILIFYWLCSYSTSTPLYPGKFSPYICPLTGERSISTTYRVIGSRVDGSLRTQKWCRGGPPEGRSPTGLSRLLSRYVVWKKSDYCRKTKGRTSLIRKNDKRLQENK